MCMYIRSSRRRRLSVKGLMGKTGEYHSSIEICDAPGDPAGAPIRGQDETAGRRPSPEGYEHRQPEGFLVTLAQSLLPLLKGPCKIDPCSWK